MINRNARSVFCMAAWFLSGSMLATCGGVAPDEAHNAPAPASAELQASSEPLVAGPSYAPVQIQAAPDANCTLAPADGSPPLAVFADEDGVVNFYAVPDATAGGNVSTLTCTDPSGAVTTYPIDLSKSATFRPLPSAPPSGRSRAHVRPALAGDPAAYTDAFLIQNGYGRRPDKTKNPADYSAWLAQANKPARLLGPRPGRTGANFGGENTTDPLWGGIMLEDTNEFYESSAANYQMPHFVYNAASPNADAGIWTGVGGWFDDALIQDGIEFYTSFKFLYSNAWVEYNTNSWDCSAPNCLCQTKSCPISMTIKPGDNIRSEVWACDSAGNVNVYGGYGCFWMVNASSNPVQIISCTTPQGSPCNSIPEPLSYFQGYTAEAIIERPSSFGLTQYSSSTNGPLSILFAAIDTSGLIRDMGTDEYANITLVNGSGKALESATVTGTESFTMKWLAGQ